MRGRVWSSIIDTKAHATSRPQDSRPTSASLGGAGIARAALAIPLLWMAVRHGCSGARRRANAAKVLILDEPLACAGGDGQECAARGARTGHFLPLT